MQKIFITTLVCCLILNLSNGFTQESYWVTWISQNTLLAGDSVRLDMMTDYDGNGEDIIFHMTVDYHCYPDRCPETDTVRSYRFEKTNDSIHTAWFYLPDKETPGKAHFYFYSEDNTIVGYTFLSIGIATIPIITHDLYDTLLCGGETFFYGVSAISLDWPEVEWYQNGVLLEEWTDTGIYVHEADFVDTGTYYCVLKNQWGVDTSRNGRISFPQLAFDLGKPSGIDHMCSAENSTTYSIPFNPDITLYSWSLYPPEAGDLTYEDTSATILWDDQFSGEANLLVKVKVKDCRGPNSDTLDIYIAGPLNGPDICIVGVDAVTGKNMVVWENPPESAVLNYIVYRETNQADMYLPLDTITADEFSIYIDANSTPEWISQRYKLSLIDTCGFESALSTAHKTIHLTNNMAANGNVNLIWDGYEGFAFLSYNLYHGPHPDSMEHINTVPSNVFIYSNIVPFEGDNFFQIEAIHPEGCSPSLKSDYGSSMSNVLYVETEDEIEGILEKQNKQITIYPSPARDMVTIMIPGYTNPVLAGLVNVSGQLVHEFIISAGSYELDISSFPEGIYILHLNMGNKPLKTKIIKSR